MWDRFGQRPIDHGWWPGIFHELVPLLFLVAIVAFGSGPCIGSRRKAAGARRRRPHAFSAWGRRTRGAQAPIRSRRARSR